MDVLALQNSSFPTEKLQGFFIPTQRTWVMLLMLPSAALYSTVGPSSSSLTKGCCFTRSKARLASRRSLRAAAESREAAGARV